MKRTAAVSQQRTALDVAVEVGNSIDFVKNLVDSMSDDELLNQRYRGYTALHYAAFFGHTEAAKILVGRNTELLYIRAKSDNLPVHIAAAYGHKKTLVYLISMFEKNRLDEDLLAFVLSSGFVDVALDIINTNPKLGSGLYRDRTALEVIASMNYLFPSGDSFKWWQNFIYSLIPLASKVVDQEYQRHNSPVTTVGGDVENQSSNPSVTSAREVENQSLSPLVTSVTSAGGDNENQSSNPPVTSVGEVKNPNSSVSNKFYWFYITICGVSQILITLLWKVVQHLVPCFKDIGDKKVKHQHALELVKCFCKRLESLPYSEASTIYNHSIISAAKAGIHEIVQVIIEMHPMQIHALDKTGRNIIHLAAENRSENVFNLIYQMSGCNYFYNSKDKLKNNLMHMCAKSAPSQKLNLVPGAALQMQRELQWFKEMEKIVPQPFFRTSVNKEGKTPQDIFTEQHEGLKTQGEKWMKDTANSCSIAAALITTIMFAAAFTIPGGLKTDTGIPIFLNKIPFILFAISDTVSFFTSITSLLMFLSILTSRYAEEDFLYVLPNRLCIGLFTLFISITFMMVAFSATIYLSLGQKNEWLLIPVAAMACLPVTLFMFLQFPLLVDVVYATYGPSIFGRKSHHVHCINIKKIKYRITSPFFRCF